ncbi:lysophospholipid acyltransferase family protein [Stieleria varia]|uniref:lysophospholipid acyltransferase family protein n=1 Tax=Stieleria varia TaxID=2528005 RepID=UPI001E604B48|nr:lysophospholipid acyltransferase family protein [Stieleria varia]
MPSIPLSDRFSHAGQRFSRFAKDYSAYLFVRMLVAIVQTLPLDMGDRMCRGIAWLAARVFKIRRSATHENLSRVFADAEPAQRDELELAMWHHLMLMVCEIAWAQRRLHLTNWTDHMSFRNHRKMLAVLLTKRPVVMVSGHFGNFEVGGYMFGMMGCESTTIARRLDNPFLHRWVERFRSAKGQYMVDKDGCAAEVQEHLESCGTLAILADQHGGPKGCWVNFLGVPASCHKALALFSLSTNAPMIAGYTIRIDRRPMQFESGTVDVADPFNDPQSHCASVSSLTQWYNRQLATAVSGAVEQYWWLHRRWRQPPEKIAKRLARKTEISRAA